MSRVIDNRGVLLPATRLSSVCALRSTRIYNQKFLVCYSHNGHRTAKQVLACANTSQSTTNKVETQKEKSSLFKKLGGGPAVKAAVDIFYDKMIADPRVSYFFEGIDMKSQRAHQAAFLTYAMGGSKSYDGNANMTAAHDRLARDLGMRMEHFDIVLEHLGGALRDLQVPEEEIGEAAAIVETLRPAFQVAVDNAAAGPQAHAGA